MKTLGMSWLGAGPFAFAVTGALLVIACSSKSNSAAPASADDSDAAADDASAQDASAPYPIASHQTAPKVTKLGGNVLATPKLVTVTFAADPLAAQVDTFAQTVGASSYWAATTSEYGVGPAVFSTAVHIADSPGTTIDDAAIETWLQSELDGTHPEWGTPDANTIYSMIYPLGTTVTLQGESICAQSPAFHSEVKLASGISVPYAVIGRCDPFLGLSGIDFLTSGLSHEWVEAATDPYYYSSPAYQEPPSKYYAWYIMTGGELADMCTLSNTVYFKPDDLPFMVQRTWSNASAAASHDPCVPAPAAPYFSAAPIMTDMVKGTFDGQKVDLEGIHLAIGASATIEVDLFSDGDSAPWTVSATAYGAGTLTFSWDKTTGQNGDKLNLTITRVKDGTDFVGVAPFLINSKIGTRKSVWIGAVGD